jgi:type IV pilus assembly protein PilM
MGAKFTKACSVVTKSDGTYIVYAAMLSSDLKFEKSGEELQIKDKIKRLTNQLKSKDNVAVLSASDVDLIFRDFSFPHGLSGEHLRGAVMLEAENSIFENINNFYSGYQELPDISTESTDVLFVASSKEKIDKKLAGLSLAEIKVKGVGVDNIALANSFITFNSAKASGSVMVIDIGHEVSKIIVIDRGRLVFMRNASFGGKYITDEIAMAYEVSYYVAEQIKRQPEVWGQIGLNIKNILKKSSNDLIEAVFRSMEYCISKQKVSKFDEIFITGGGAMLRSLDNFIWETLGVNTVKWNPFESDIIRGVYNADKGFFIPVALGLAVTKEMDNV